MKLDSRILLIVLLISLIVYGEYALNWSVDYDKTLMFLAVGILTHGLFSLAFKIPINAILNTIITSLLLSIIMDSSYMFICGMASFFAVSSKFIFQYKNRHIFNPAMFGIVFTILFTGVLEFSNFKVDWILTSLIAFSSLIILYRSRKQKADVIIFFLFLFFLSHYAFKLVSDYDSYIYDFYNLHFILFSFIFIADPVSSPDSRIGRFIWTLLIVVLSHTLLDLGIKYGYYIALFLSSGAVPILDKFFKKGQRFSWDSIQKRELYSS